MTCPARLRSGLILCLGLATAAVSTSAAAAGADERRPDRPVWGTVVAAGDGSLTVQPEPPARRRAPRRGAPRDEAPPPAPPAERVFAVDEEQTEVMFAEVRREMMMNDGTTLRTFESPRPGTPADLKPGQPVEVTARDGVATRVIIAWGVRGTLVRAGPDSVTFRPERQQGPREERRRRQQPDDAEDADDAGGEEPDEQTVKADRDTTEVTFHVLVAEGPAAGGRFVKRYQVRPGHLGELKPGDLVVVCVKDGAAEKITVLAPAEGGE